MADFAARISVLCFAASYSVSLLLELTRLWFRSGLRGAVMIGFAGAGLFAHTLYLWSRAVHSTSLPLSSAYDWYLVAAWILAVAYLYLTFSHRHSPMGVFLLPIVLGLVFLAQLADDQPFAQQPASRMWGMLHGIFLLLGTVAASVGFATGLMYLLQAHRLKNRHPVRGGLRLPSLEWLEGASKTAIAVSVPMLGIGLAAGAVLNLVNHHREVDTIVWTDPVILASSLMFLCMVVAALFNVFYQTRDTGRRVAYTTILTFVLLLIALGFSLFSPTQHGRGGVPLEHIKVDLEV